MSSRRLPPRSAESEPRADLPPACEPPVDFSEGR